MELMLLLLVLLPVFGGLFSWFVGRDNEQDRDIFNVALTGLEFLVVCLMYPFVAKSAIHLIIPNVMGTGLYFKLDMFRYMFIWVTSAVWFLTTVYSTQYLIKYKNRNRYYLFFMVTLAGTIGFFLSENLLNIFTFFELLSFTSYFLIIHDEDRYAHRAGLSYISMAVTGGLVMLLGIFLLYDYTGTINLSVASMQMMQMGTARYVIGGLLIFGFGVKAAIVPLHVWLPKAHPAAPTPASAILSGILIKVGIFGILLTEHTLLSGDPMMGTVLVAIGMAGMLSGGFQALFQRNMKRILAFSSMSQGGYLVFGIGLAALTVEAKGLALLAVIMHVVNHAVFKVLLFLGAGVIYMVLHELSLNVISGFGRHKNKLKGLFLIGMLALMGVPGTGGYVSKTLLHETMTEVFHHSPAWVQGAMEIGFTLASAMTTAYMLKIFISVFMTENEAYQGQYKNAIKKRALIPMAVLAGLIIGVGVYPWPLIHVAEKAVATFQVEAPHHFHFFSLHAYQSAAITIALGGLLYAFGMRPVLQRDLGKRVIWINPTINWFQLEEDLYVPVLLKLSDVSLWLFRKIDGFMLKVVVLMRFGMARIGNVDLADVLTFDWTKLRFERPGKTQDAIDLNAVKNSAKARAASAQQQVGDTVKGAVESAQNSAEKRVKDVVETAHRKASSMTWALYMVAAVLLVILGWMLLRG